jgi:outer membrane protein insertion porin family
MNNELYLPVPGANADRTLRMFLYGDIGNVWGESERVTFESLRASLGAGVSWISPVGPLRLGYGDSVREQPNDRIQRLQFQIGTAF